MIKLLLKGISNPHGMIAQAIIKLVAKHFKHWGKYIEEDNELDVQMRDIEKKCTDIGFQVTAMKTVLKDLGDNTHPPAIDLEELEELKADMKKIKNKKWFKKLG